MTRPILITIALIFIIITSYMFLDDETIAQKETMEEHLFTRETTTKEVVDTTKMSKAYIKTLKRDYPVENQIHLDAELTPTKKDTEQYQVDTMLNESISDEDIVMMNEKFKNNGDKEEIIPGEGIQPIDIEDYALNSEEKDRMTLDMLYFKALHESTPSIQISENEILKMIEKDLELNQIIN